MPNHCSNRLTVEGPDASRFFALIQEQEDENFIEYFIPTPAVLEDIDFEYHEGQNIQNLLALWMAGKEGEGTYYRGGATLEDGKIVVQDRVYLTDEEVASLIETYGVATERDFHEKYWGSKWGAYDVVIHDGWLYFESAWCPPREGILIISTMFPDATFLLEYAEPGMVFCGSYLFKNGKIITYSNFEGEEAIAQPLYEDVLGYVIDYEDVG